jgi:hypothetical protein
MRSARIRLAGSKKHPDGSRSEAEMGPVSDVESRIEAGHMPCRVIRVLTRYEQHAYY